MFDLALNRPIGSAAEAVRDACRAAPVPWLIGAHLLLWMWVGTVSRSNLDLPGDMVEAYVWSQGWQWGYFKHPPLSAWIAGAWFSVAPRTDAGFAALSAVVSAIGLTGTALLAREFLSGRWVVLAVAIASLAPGLTAWSLRFNCNSVLVAVWPWALYASVHLLRTGSARAALLCGLTWALAMLGKYYSGVLLVTVCAAVLLVAPWRARAWQRRGAVALAALAGAVVIAPHLHWLATHGGGPLHYAQAATGKGGVWAASARGLHFTVAHLGFPLVALLVLLGAIERGHRWAAVSAVLKGMLRPRRDFVWLLALLPVALTVLVTVLTSARTVAPWGMGLAGSMALLVAHGVQRSGARLSLRRLYASLALVWLAVAVLAPLSWLAIARQATPKAAEPRQELAAHVQHEWRTAFGTPLRWVSGDRVLSASTAFYASDRPGYWSVHAPERETPWVDLLHIARDGGALICALDDAECSRHAQRLGAATTELVVAKAIRGFRFPAQRFALHLIAPSGRAIGSGDGDTVAR